ncbi:nucleotidyltransferase family protein [Roseobacter sp.]|uniref:nucleotidyltransferase family protein n=1 Tax=Roseobacter sp. TaxID=1907202 RepID=UPI003297DCCF
MKALLLAAGFGTRLRPITDSVPKCLVPIHGRPLLDYWFELVFATNAIDRALVNTHYLPDQVVAHVQASPWRDRIDLVHEDVLLGTGGTILQNRRYFDGQDFLLVHADNLSSLDVRWLQHQHHARTVGCAMTMLAFRTDVPQSCGILECDAHGVVQAFHEKVANPPDNLANGAVYIMGPEILAATAALGKPEVDLSTEVIPQFVGRIQSAETTAYHRDIGTPTSLAAAHQEFPRPT